MTAESSRNWRKWDEKHWKRTVFSKSRQWTTGHGTQVKEKNFGKKNWIFWALQVIGRWWIGRSSGGAECASYRSDRRITTGTVALEHGTNTRGRGIAVSGGDASALWRALSFFFFFFSFASVAGVSLFLAVSFLSLAIISSRRVSARWRRFVAIIAKMCAPWRICGLCGTWDLIAF